MEVHLKGLPNTQKRIFDGKKRFFQVMVQVSSEGDCTSHHAMLSPQCHDGGATEGLDALFTVTLSVTSPKVLIVEHRSPLALCYLCKNYSQGDNQHIEPFQHWMTSQQLHGSATGLIQQLDAACRAASSGQLLLMACAWVRSLLRLQQI